MAVKTKEKKFNVVYNVGKIKYLVSFYDGIKKHKDGSDFYDVKTFNNKVLLKKFTNSLLKDGYSGTAIV